MRPLLACSTELEDVVFPCYVSEKLDGVRCLLQKGGAVARSLKDIPNLHIRETLKGLVGFEGELMLRDGGDFNAVQSAVMSVSGKPDFTLNVFDSWVGTEPFERRLSKLYQLCNNTEGGKLEGIVKPIPQYYMINIGELTRFYEKVMRDGGEGVIIRSPKGRYKFGRSTLNEGYLLRIVPWIFDEGVVVRIEEKMTNGNPATVNELGFTARSSAKAGKVPAGTAGAIVVKWKDKVFKLGFGKGFDDKAKQKLWDERADAIGHPATFYYKNLTEKGVPRQGKLKGIRATIEGEFL